MNRESERYRLITKLYDSKIIHDHTINEGIAHHTILKLADYILDNGIVVPAYSIGERVFVVITYMPFVPDDVYECKIKAWMRYADKLSALVEIVEEGIYKGLAVNVDNTNLFTSMAAAQTILEAKLNGGGEG